MRPGELGPEWWWVLGSAGGGIVMEGGALKAGASCEVEWDTAVEDDEAAI